MRDILIRTLETLNPAWKKRPLCTEIHTYPTEHIANLIFDEAKDTIATNKRLKEAYRHTQKTLDKIRQLDLFAPRQGGNNL